MTKKPYLQAPGNYKKELSSLLRENARHKRLSQVFSDFCELGALMYSNAVDKKQFDVREARYFEIIRRYEKDEIKRFSEMHAVLALWAECGMADYLGELFMSLELGDSFKGQFFTPYSVCSLMAGITLGDASQIIEQQGFVSLSDPAVGAGALVIASADALLSQDVNYQHRMHATAVDIDATAVHMAYLQFVLFHIPAIVVHGNSLSLEEWGYWVTPAHVWGGWDYRLRRRQPHARPEDRASSEIARVEPMPAAAGDESAAPGRASPDEITNFQQRVITQRVDQMSLFG